MVCIIPYITYHRAVKAARISDFTSASFSTSAASSRACLADSRCNCPSDQAACARTIGSCSCFNTSLSGDRLISACEFPSAIVILRKYPLRLARLSGLRRYFRLKSFAERVISSCRSGVGRVRLWLNAGSPSTAAKWFHGQTDWHTSHPNTHPSIRGRSSAGIDPFSSIVR